LAGLRQAVAPLYGDAIRLTAARAHLSADAYGLRHAKLQARMLDIALAAWANPHARRLAKRLLEYGEYLLTFVEFAGVPADNNRAEREIRPAVLMRKARGGRAGRADDGLPHPQAAGP
jgi:hypothetical protein